MFSIHPIFLVEDAIAIAMSGQQPGLIAFKKKGGRHQYLIPILKEILPFS